MHQVIKIIKGEQLRYKDGDDALSESSVAFVVLVKDA